MQVVGLIHQFASSRVIAFWHHVGPLSVRLTNANVENAICRNLDVGHTAATTPSYSIKFLLDFQHVQFRPRLYTIVYTSLQVYHSVCSARSPAITTPLLRHNPLSTYSRPPSSPSRSPTRSPDHPLCPRVCPPPSPPSPFSYSSIRPR